MNSFARIAAVCSLALALALAFAVSAARAQTTVAENTAGTYPESLPATSRPYTFYAGQSFTTANNGTGYTLGTICLLTAGGSPSGSGSLYLFSAPYGGVETDLSTTTTNLLGSATWSGASSCWDFSAANITLNEATIYYFFIAPDSSGLSFGFGSTTGSDAVDLYSGGEYYVATASANIFNALPSDLDFRVTGAAVPEPATCAALAGIGALGLVLWRRRSAHARRA